jgi:hypothetical protein
MDSSSQPAAPAARTIPRPVVVALLALLVAGGFWLRIEEFRFGLPYPLHSDYIQVTQAAQFLSEGHFIERAPYPATHTWVYVAADLVAFAADRASGFAGWESWDDFVRDLQNVGVHHAIGRVYTAFVGAWLAVGVYLLARVRFPRGTALLAAAAATLCPAFVIYSHQVRVHVPGITLLAFAAVPVLRLVLDPAPAGKASAIRRALLAGAAAGAVASVFQLGFVLLASCGVLLLCLVRPFPRMLRDGLLVIAGFALVFFAICAVARWPGVVSDPPGEVAMRDIVTLGIPAPLVGLFFAERFPAFVSAYVLSEPVRVLGVLLFLWACWRGRHRWRDAVAYGCYPVLLILILGTNYTNVRYSMSATVFLAALAAAGCLAVRLAWARAGLAALLLLAPLASSVRYDILLRRADTRLALDSLLHQLDTTQTRVCVESALVLGPDALPPNVVQFPPDGNFKPWYMQGVSPRATLQGLRPTLFIRTPGRTMNGMLNDDGMHALGFFRCATVDSGNSEFSFLPDASPALAFDLWRAQRPGPSLEFWSRNEVAAEFLRRRARELGLLAAAP